MKITSKLWLGIAVLIGLSPLGLILPEHFKAGPAWGEWGADEMRKLVGYIPRGMQKLSGFWSAPIPGYGFKCGEDKGLPHLSFAYILSAIVGISIIILVVMAIGKLLTRKDEQLNVKK